MGEERLEGCQPAAEAPMPMMGKGASLPLSETAVSTKAGVPAAGVSRRAALDERSGRGLPLLGFGLRLRGAKTVDTSR